MPTPTVITDLSTVIASNFPAGSNAPSVLDDVQRAHAAFIAQLRDRTATDWPNTPAGNIAATTVQAAINELDTEKLALSGGAMTGALSVGAGMTVTAAALLGYGTGSGGTVTQATSKSTAVTLNKPTGQITTNSASLAAAATVTFIFNNSLLTTADVVVPMMQNGALSAQGAVYSVYCDSVSAGSCRINIKNNAPGALAEALIINFIVIKGAAA